MKILHRAIPGRARFHVEPLYRDEGLASWLASALTAEHGVREATASALTCSVLVSYQRDETSPARIRRTIRSLLARAPRDAALPARRPARDLLWHQLSAPEALAHWGTDPVKGLARPLADRRRRGFGPNTVAPLSGRGMLDVLTEQFTNLPTLLLIGSASISVLSGGLADAAIILSVVLLNGGIGFATEASAEKSISALIRTPETKASVVRGGRRLLVPAADLVPGDLLLVFPGMRVPADARLVEADNLTVDESALTGESLPVLKCVSPLPFPELALGDQKNVLFRGTVVTGGSGRAVVVRTGANTEVGRIQQLMGHFSQPRTPLQTQLEHLGNRMVYVSLGMSGAVLLIGAARGLGFLHLLKTAISLAVAAIPESLPTIATTTLARGIHTLEREGVLVRHLDALETLGGVDVLCLDKTGTLTQNRMTASEIVTAAARFEVGEKGILRGGRAVDSRRFGSLHRLLRTCSLCNEAKLPRLAKSKAEALPGSPTEQALLQVAELAGIDTEHLRKTFRLVGISHRTEKKSYMTTTHRVKGSRRLVAMKGRPEEVLALCARVRRGNRAVPLTEQERERIRRENARMAARGLRVLGVASKELRGESGGDGGMTWLGLIGLADPIRPGVAEWIEKFHAAGVRTVMITGDQSATAEAIGRTLRLSGDESLEVVDFASLRGKRRADLESLSGSAHVFSRVSPGDKLRIVKALQGAGRVVAMVGDGINDGPALKIADIGVALGDRGAQVASEVADIVLLNDSLDRLVLGLEEGRRIQEDIKKAVDYILTQNFAEMLFTLTSVSLGFGEPLSPIQFLWMNLVTDLFPELALAQEPSEPGCLSRKPIHAEDRLFQRDDVKRMLAEAGLLTASSFASYAFACRLYGNGARARTVAFQTLIAASLLYTLSARSERISVLSRTPMPSNPWVPLSVGAGFVAEGLALFLPPLRRLLGTTTLAPGAFLTSAVGACAPFALIEIGKLLRQNGARAA